MWLEFKHNRKQGGREGRKEKERKKVRRKGRKERGRTKMQTKTAPNPKYAIMTKVTKNSSGTRSVL
jgi:hypothetical protein